MKIKVFDKYVVGKFLSVSAYMFAVCSVLFLFIDVPDDWRPGVLAVIIAVLLLMYVFLWFRYEKLKNVSFRIDGSTVSIVTGDIFCQEGFKAIAFNEYFDTLVDDKIIAKRSLNGVFIDKYIKDLEGFNGYIDSYSFDDDELLGVNSNRKAGKKKRFKLGTICVYEDYILTAFSKFDDNNRAYLTMPEYLEFLINFWDRVNKVYAQKSVSTTIFGSGITRIKGHKNITDEELLKIMLWTFRISEMTFKYPAKLTIVIHPEKIDQINLLDVMSAKNGI